VKRTLIPREAQSLGCEVAYDLDGLADPANLRILRLAFTDPAALRPGTTRAAITEQAAERFGSLALSLERRGIAPPVAAHFLMQLLFCLFAEDIGLLPDRLFTRLVETTRTRPDQFHRRLRQLFAAMGAPDELLSAHSADPAGDLLAGRHQPLAAAGSVPVGEFVLSGYDIGLVAFAFLLAAAVG